MTDVAPPNVSLWEDFLEIFYAPSRVFARRGGNDWGIPLLVLVVLMAIITFASWGLVKPLIDSDAARDMAAQSLKQHWTPEQADQARVISSKIISIVPYSLVGFTAIGPLLIGLFLWLAGRALGAVEKPGEAIMIAAYSLFPRLIGGVVVALQAAVLPDEKLTGLAAVNLGPARFLDPATTGSAMMVLLGRFDLFILWSTLLLAIGLKVKGRISLGQAAIAAFVLWLLGSLAQMAPVLLKG